MNRVATQAFLGMGLMILLGWFAPSARAAWGPEERLTVNSTVAETGLNHGALARDSQGRITAAWAEQDGPRANFQIYTRVREASGFWQTEELAVAFDTSYVGSTLGAKFPALAHVADDSLLMVWHDYRVAGILNLELYARIRAPGEAWGGSTSEVRLTTSQHPETLGDNSYVPSLAVTPNGSAHTVWYDYRFEADHAEILFKSRTGGAWDLTPGDAPDTNLSVNVGESTFPALAAGPDGSLHLAWRDDTGGWFRIAYRRRDTAGAWGAMEWLSPDGFTADGVALDVAPDGTVIAVWSDTRTGQKALYSRERAGGGAGGWGPPRRVSPDGVGAEEPDVAVGPTGRRHVVWQDARVSVFNREVFHQAIDAGGVWDSTGVSDFQVSSGSGKSSRPTLLAGGAEAFVLWQDARHGAEEIYFRALSGDVTGVSDPGSTSRPGLAAWPNPFRGSLAVLGLAPGPIDVWDVRGRRVSTLLANGSVIRWDGTTETEGSAPAGVYFLRERRPGAQPLRVVRLP